jgi:microcompartment protein CcmK/EutM
MVTFNPSKQHREINMLVIYIVTYKSVGTGKKENVYFTNESSAEKWANVVNGTVKLALVNKD